MVRALVCGLNGTFLPEIHLVFAICDVSPLVILTQFQKNISPFSLLDHLFQIVTGKCWFLSLRVKLESHSVYSLFLGWAVFSSLETFLILFLFWRFPHRVPHPVYLSLTYCRAVTPFLISKCVICTSDCFLCLHFWFDVLLSLNITAFFALLFQLSRLLLLDVFQFVYSFHHGITAFFGGGRVSWSVPVSIVFRHISFTEVITQFVLFVPGAFQVPSFKKQTS